jgi:hypothetical protein
MAEIELNVLNNHGLTERIPNIEQMGKGAEAWNRRRNKEACKINWRFTTADARIKLIAYTHSLNEVWILAH